jgi:hypothetical protein
MGATGDDFDMFDDDALPPPTAAAAKGGKNSKAPQLRRAEFAEGDDDDDEGGDDGMRLYDELKNKQTQAKADKKAAKMYAHVAYTQCCRMNAQFIACSTQVYIRVLSGSIVSFPAAFFLLLS